jgi:16S rRNA (guanine527-N7)-methyltransferase
MPNLLLTYLNEHFGEDSAKSLFPQFQRYAQLLEAQSKIHNLTAIAPEEYDEKHFLDSLLLMESYPFQDERIIDVGTGAGFPGLVLAIAFPKLYVTLLEPTRKRCDFLTIVVEVLKLSNVTIVNERAEDYVKRARETFDLATSRAVANLSIILELSTPLVKKGGSVLVMKGKNFHEELQEAQHAISVLKLEQSTTKIHHLPTDESMRVNARFIKKEITNMKYPRAYGQIKKNPL